MGMPMNACWFNSRKAMAPDRLPVYDVFHCRQHYVCILGPYYTRAGFAGGVKITVNGQKCGWWMLPTHRHFTMSVMAEIPRSLRAREQWKVVVELDGKRVFRGIVYRITRPAGRLAMATLTKFDAAYIGEWIEHNLLLGFEHFFVYNNGEPAITKAIDTYVLSGLATEVNWSYPYAMCASGLDPYWPPDSHHWTQPPQQVHAVLKYGDNWDWIGLFDADEFLVPMTDSPLLDTLDAAAAGMWCELPYGRCGGVEVQGRWFGTSGHARTKTPILPNYMRCEAGHTTAPKWLIRPDCMREAVVHYYEIDGQPARMPTNVLRYNHYRSISDHKLRCQEADHEHYSNETTDGRVVEVQHALD